LALEEIHDRLDTTPHTRTQSPWLERLELGSIDELELYVVPRLLGDVVKLRYRVDKRGDPARALSG
jgi:hypothetical protein